MSLILILDVYLMIWSGESVYYKCYEHEQCFGCVAIDLSDYMVKNTILKLILKLYVSPKLAPYFEQFFQLLVRNKSSPDFEISQRKVMGRKGGGRGKEK